MFLPCQTRVLFKSHQKNVVLTLAEVLTLRKVNDCYKVESECPQGRTGAEAAQKREEARRPESVLHFEPSWILTRMVSNKKWRRADCLFHETFWDIEGRMKGNLGSNLFRFPEWGVDMASLIWGTTMLPTLQNPGTFFGNSNSKVTV